MSTTSVLPQTQDILHAYRHLYRQLLHCVQYSKPSRYTARDQLRDAFRKGDASSFNQARISRTLVFLQAATKERGIEHKLVKNLLYVERDRRQRLREYTKIQHNHVSDTAFIHYQMTIAMLNDSMGLCLR